MSSVGDMIEYKYDNEEILAEIFNIYEQKNTYDTISPNERNVLIESIQDNDKKRLKKGDIVMYRKKDKNYEVYITKIDWNSQSAQVKIIHRNINPNINNYSFGNNGYTWCVTM